MSSSYLVVDANDHKLRFADYVNAVRGQDMCACLDHKYTYIYYLGPIVF